MAFEMKFRFKGEIKVATVSEYGGCFPKELIPPEGFLGVDLTCFRVFYISAGRRGDQKAARTSAANPGVVVVYQYSWRNGFGDGVILPENFDLRRVKFYKSSEQVKAEAEAKRDAKLALLIEAVSALRPEGALWVHRSFLNDGVIVKPKHSPVYALSDYDWGFFAASVEEAAEKLPTFSQLWETWTKLASEVWAAHNGGVQSDGQIQITSPYPGATTVKVYLDFHCRKAAIVEKDADGVWKDTGREE